jgi:hypothetical protein
MTAGPTLRRALILSASLATTVALGGVSAGPSRADTGGSELVYVVPAMTSAGFRSTADHPKQKTPLVVPHVAAGASAPIVDDVVPSPDSTRIAEAFRYTTSAGERLAVTIADDHGAHQHRLWTKALTSANLVAGMAWSADGNHLYFGSATRGSDSGSFGSRLLTARIRPSIGAVRNVQGGRGLSWPSADPMSSTVAAVRDGIGCRRSDPGGGSPVTATIVLLDPSTGHASDLKAVTAPKARCADPVTHLAWSPDGEHLAYARYRYGADLRGVGDVMMMDPAHSHRAPQLAISGKGLHIAMAPAWQNANSLWCEWVRVFDDQNARYSRPDLMSAAFAGGSFAAPVNQTESPHIAETVPSFG